MCISNLPLAESSKIMADCSDVTVFVTPGKYCDSKYIFILCYRKRSNYEKKLKQNKTADRLLKDKTLEIHKMEVALSCKKVETWQQTFLIFIIYVSGQEHMQHILLHLLTLQSVGRKWPIRKLLGKVSVGEDTDHLAKFHKVCNLINIKICSCTNFETYCSFIFFIVFSPIRALRICFALSSAVALLRRHRLILDI